MKNKLIVGKNILIVGINSFLASYLTTQLKYDNNLYGVYNNKTDNIDETIESISINNIQDLNIDIDFIFIIAAYIPSNDFNPELTIRLVESNVLLVDKICKQFHNAKIIYCSSVSVYGLQTGIINEKSSINSPNQYGISKYWGEEIVRKTNNYSILRISSIYGVGMSQNTFLPKIINDAIRTRTITIYGDGERSQNYIYVSDVVNYLIHAAVSSENGTFLVTASESYSNKFIAEFLALKLNSEIKYQFEDNSLSYFYNNNLTREKLNILEGSDFLIKLDSLTKWLQKIF